MIYALFFCSYVIGRPDMNACEQLNRPVSSIQECQKQADAWIGKLNASYTYPDGTQETRRIVCLQKSPTWTPIGE